MIACIGLVIGFRSSANLASAYGLAVTATMVITTVLFFVVARERLKIRIGVIVAACAVFLVVDTAFLGANLFKIPSGGWFPLVIGALVFTILVTWRRGRELVAERIDRDRTTLEQFVDHVRDEPPLRVPGASIYLFSSTGLAPPSLIANRKHHQALHEDVVVLAILTEPIPHVAEQERAVLTDLGEGFWSLVAHYGFLDEPHIPTLLASDALEALHLDLDDVTYFLGRESLRATDRPGMALWREKLFALMARNATPAANYFGLPTEQTIDVGVQVDL